MLAAQAAALTGWVSAAGAAGVLVRDVERASGPLAKALFFATPVAFDPAVLPASWRLWLLANPAAVFVESWRCCLAGRWDPSVAAAAGVHAVLGLAAAALISSLVSPRLAEYA